MKSPSFYRRWAGVTLLVLVLVLVVWLLGGWAVDRALTKEVVSDYNVWQASGELLQVSVLKRTKGFFISGGHSWSIGDTRDEYEVSFVHGARTLRWQGPGVPVLLRQRGAAFYLATFDRETNWVQADFRCFVWEEGGWKGLPVKQFPRSLALGNLMEMESGYVLENPAFTHSLLARFWFCIDYDLPAWQVSDAMVTEEFVRQFAEKMKEESAR